jgi:hypothetical protein
VSAATMAGPVAQPIRPIDLLPTATVRERYPDLWATYRERLPTLDDQQLATAVSVAVGVCLHCFEAPRGCSCSF